MHALLMAAMLAIATPVLADEVREERIQFEAGASSGTVEGTVQGYNSVHYLVGASAGQHMTVTLSSDHGGNEFHVYAPGDRPGESTALDIGTDGGPQFFDETLPADGDYLIQVYLVRAAARREEQASYTLEVTITSDGAAATQEGGDAKVTGTDFHATGQIPCARSAGQPMGACPFGVVREGDRNGHIHIDWPDGGARVIFFTNNTPEAYDRSEADGDADITVRREVDLFFVQIGEQRFEIPEAVMTGG